MLSKSLDIFSRFSKLFYQIYYRNSEVSDKEKAPLIFESLHPKLGAKLFYSLVSRSEVISKEMSIDCIETPETLPVFPREGSSFM